MPILGCPREYKVELLYVRRETDTGDPLPKPVMYRQTVLDGVTRVEWSRVADAVSEATVTIGGDTGAGVCCRQLENISPWDFEIRIYRDGNPVWEGPIVEPVFVTRDQPVTISAKDISVWGDRTQNTQMQRYNDDDVAFMARDQITRNLRSAYWDTPDWPLLLDYIYTEPIDEPIDLRRNLVAESLTATLEELKKYGLRRTVVGRSWFLIPGADTNTPVTARLTSADYDTPTEIAIAGEEVANLAFVYWEKDDTQNISPYGARSSRYGSHQVYVKVDPDTSAKARLRAAKVALKGRAEPPIVVRMPGSAALYPTAPLSIDQLIPAWTRIDVAISSDEVCIPVLQPAQFSDVRVTWVPGLETVQVGVVPVGRPLSLMDVRLL